METMMGVLIKLEGSLFDMIQKGTMMAELTG